MTEVEGSKTCKEVQVSVAFLVVNPNTLSESFNPINPSELHKPRQAGVDVARVKFGDPLVIAHGIHLQTLQKSSAKNSLA